jgi:hypothetical protein
MFTGAAYAGTFLLLQIIIPIIFDFLSPFCRFLFTLTCFIAIFFTVNEIYNQYPIFSIALILYPISAYLMSKDDYDSSIYTWLLTAVILNFILGVMLLIIGGGFMGLRECALIDFIGIYELKLNYVILFCVDIIGIFSFIIKDK